jgi:acyl-CoA reductase-like NAD-dependent aldehyde dehydrogenase
MGYCPRPEIGMAELSVTNPWNGNEIARLPTLDGKQAQALLATAHARFTRRDGWLPPFQRIQILRNLHGLVEARFDDLVAEAAREGGKPWVDTEVEIRRGIEGIDVAIRELESLGGRQVPLGITPSSTGRMAFTYYEPRGIVLAISAFNHPFNLVIHQVVPAVAAGCPVIIKPALDTPLSARNVVNMLREAGLPDGWCSLCICDNNTTTELVADPRVAFLSFVGSAKVGWMLRSKLSPGAACVLEHGGRAPVLIRPTADLADAIPRLVKGGFYHAGQVCVSVQRVYVPREMVQEFAASFVTAVRDLKVGDPLDELTDVGPLIRPTEVDRVHRWVCEAIEAGAKLLCGGKPLGTTSYAPTVLLDPPEDIAITNQEIFGPVVCLYTYDAVSRANQPDVFFQASVWTKDLDEAMDLGRRLDGMAVMVNDHTAFRVDWMPFGGHRSSGLGVGGIGYALRDLMLERMLVVRSPAL